jgi:hypothetical protein
MHWARRSLEMLARINAGGCSAEISGNCGQDTLEVFKVTRLFDNALWARGVGVGKFGGAGGTGKHYDGNPRNGGWLGAHPLHEVRT